MTMYNHKIYFTNGMHMTLKQSKMEVAEIMFPKDLREDGCYTFEADIDGKKHTRTYRPKFVVFVESEQVD